MEDPLSKENFRPVSVVSVVSKIFERLLQKQMSCYVEKFLSPYLCGFIAQQALISLIEKWKSNSDKKTMEGQYL